MSSSNHKTNEMLSISKRQYAVSSTVKAHASGQVKALSSKALVNEVASKSTEIIESQKGEFTVFDAFAIPSVTLPKCNKMLLPDDKIRLFKPKDSQLVDRWRKSNEPIKQLWVATNEDALIKELDLTGDEGDQKILFGQIMDYLLTFGYKRARGNVSIEVVQRGSDLHDGDVLYFVVCSIYYPTDFKGLVYVEFRNVHIDVVHNTYYVSTDGRSFEFEDPTYDRSYDLDDRDDRER